MKRLLTAALLALIATPCLAAGTINLSLSQQFDSQGHPLSGCNLYFYAAGTTTPQSAYQDTGLSIAYPNPMQCDASGRIPQFFLADGNIKIRLADRNGNTILAADNLLVVGASSGGGGGGSVDATTVLATGDIKIVYSTGPLTGFVRANGRTIGSATSGATERANSDTQALFEFLWNTDANLTVSTGRGASSTADWTANKTITLPDARGRVIAALDDMGTTSAARINTLSSVTLGATGGGQTVQISTTNLPAISYTPAGTVSVSLSDPGHNHAVSDGGHSHSISDPGHVHSYNQYGSVAYQAGGSGTVLSTTAGGGQNTASSVTGISVQSATTGININSHNTGITVSSSTFSGNSASLGGSSTAMNVLQPTILMTFYIKL